MRVKAEIRLSVIVDIDNSNDEDEIYDSILDIATAAVNDCDDILDYDEIEVVSFKENKRR